MGCRVRNSKNWALRSKGRTGREGRHKGKLEYPLVHIEPSAAITLVNCYRSVESSCLVIWEQGPVARRSLKRDGH